jgi:hypothetical protein
MPNWKKELRNIPLEVARYCEVYSFMHKDMSIRHYNYYKWIAVASVVLQAYLAIVIITVSQEDAGTSPLAISGIIAAFLNAACSGLETRFNWRVSKHKHKQYSSAYSKLQRNIRVKCIAMRGDVTQFINWANTQYDVLSSESPNVDSDIIEQYGKKHPKLNLFYPGFIRDDDGDNMEDLKAIADQDDKKTPDAVTAKRQPTLALKRFSTVVGGSGTFQNSRQPNSAGRKNRRTTWDPSAGDLAIVRQPSENHRSPLPSGASTEDLELGMLMQQFNKNFGQSYRFDDPRPQV